MNENEKARIAAAIHALRPDWPAASLRTLLDRPQLANNGRRDVAVALAWVACESESQTPARVLEAGPWWKAAAAEGGSVQPTYSDEWCWTCNHTERICRQINSHDHEFVSVKDRRPSRREEPPELIAAMRADIAAAKHVETEESA